MFTAKYFNPRYWAGRYWTKIGGEIIKPSGYLKGKTIAYPTLNGQCSTTQALSGNYSVYGALNGETNVIN